MTTKKLKASRYLSAASLLSPFATFLNQSLLDSRFSIEQSAMADVQPVVPPGENPPQDVDEQGGDQERQQENLFMAKKIVFDGNS